METDLGFQLYMPWRISQGGMLYRDGTSLYGPLSQYFHALWFRLFGPSLTVLIVNDLVQIVAFTLVLYVLFTRMSDRLTGTVITLVFLLAFAFGYYVPNGNYTYVLPYSPEAADGLYVSVLGLTLLWLWFETRRPVFASTAGLAMGLAFLTKPELFFAIAAASLAGFTMSYFRWRNRALLFQAGAALLASLCTPLALFFVYFASATSLAESLRMIFQTWIVLFISRAISNTFYLVNLGWDKPVENLLLMLTQSACVLTVALGCFLFCRWSATMNMARRIAAIAFPAILVAASFRYDWVDAGRSFPILNMLIVLHLAWSWVRAEDTDDRLSLALLWSVFSLFLLAKMGLNSRIWHYGFVLGLPSALTIVYYFAWFLPHALGRFGVHVRLFRGTVLATLAVGLFLLTTTSLSIYRQRTYRVGRDGDAILTFPAELDPTGLAINLTLDWIRQNVPADATLAVLPEGVLINYLSRHPNPTKYHGAIMTRIGGGDSDEAAMLEAYASTPPDFVILFQRDTSEFDLPYYGRSADFGLGMRKWLEQSYTPVYLIGDEPLRDEKFGVEMFKLRPAAPVFPPA